MIFCGRCMEKLGENPICPHCGHDNREVQNIPYALKPGTILNGKYLIGNVLGQGGFGITYIGFDLALEIRVAIKEYYVAGSASRMDGKTQAVYWTQKPDNMDHFIKEARRMAKLENMPEVAHVRDVFYANNTAYIIMEFVKGDSLKHHLMKNGTMSYEQTVKLMLPVIHALGRVHDENIIHRDITPDNLMMEPAGKLRVLDLGAAGDLTQNDGQASQLVARHGFSPYEQYLAKGKIGPWTDVYAVCATIYYCCTGKVIPNAYDRVDQFMTTQNSELEMDPSIPAAGAKVLQKGMTLDVVNRIQNMQELAAQLEKSLMVKETASPARKAPVNKTPVKGPASVQKPVPEKPKRPPQRTEVKEKRKRGARGKKMGLIAAAVVLVVAAALFLAFSKSGWQQTENGQYQYYQLGAPVKEWKKVDAEYFYFNEEGIMLTGWQTIDEDRYYFGDGGSMRTGWQTLNGKVYYFGDSGVMRTGWAPADGKQYYFGSDGVMRTGWQSIGGDRYYLGSDGAMRTGWYTLNGDQYYFASQSGIMLTNWVAIDGNKYFLGDDGIMRTRWQEIDGDYYYFGSNGVMRTGWKLVNGRQYYFGDNGIMRTGWVTINGVQYYFDENGVYQG